MVKFFRVSAKGEFVRRMYIQFRCELAHATGKLKTIQDIEDLFVQLRLNEDETAPARLYCLEVMLIDQLQPQDLKLRNVGLRDMLTHLLPPESYAILSSNFLPLKEADLNDPAGIKKIRDETYYLASRVHRRYGSVPTVEELRAKLAKAIFKFLSLLIVLAVTLASFAAEFQYEKSFLVCSVMVAGALGASLSTVVRLYAIDPRNEPGNTWLSIESGEGTIMIAPLLGMAFAIVLLLLLKGMLISGALFPDFGPDALGTVTSVTELNEPKKLQEFAKLLVWGFISGWAERAVPDVLDRLASQAQKKILS